MSDKIDISIIVPMYNEEEVLDAFFLEIKKTLENIPEYSYEIVCIDDGSTDSTLDKLKSYAENDKRIKIISFSRNFGKEAGMMAGLKNCCGRCAIPIDADLQDPPELIFEFLKKWNEGHDVVYGTRINRPFDSILKKITSNYFYKIYNFVSNRKIPENTGDYRLISRNVIDSIINLNEKNLFMKGIYNWVGFNSSSVNYERPERVGGNTKWNYWKLWNFSLDGITSSTTIPLRIWSYFGLLLLVISSIYSTISIINSSFSLILFIVLILFSIQFIALGIFGEYIGRMFMEVKNRPLYIIKEKVNFYE